MTKFKQIFTRLFWSESQQEIILASNEEAEFNLKLGKMLVELFFIVMVYGTLTIAMLLRYKIAYRQ